MRECGGYQWEFQHGQNGVNVHISVADPDLALKGDPPLRDDQFALIKTETKTYVDYAASKFVVNFITREDTEPIRDEICWGFFFPIFHSFFRKKSRRCTTSQQKEVKKEESVKDEEEYDIKKAEATRNVAQGGVGMTDHRPIKR